MFPLPSEGKTECAANEATPWEAAGSHRAGSNLAYERGKELLRGQGKRLTIEKKEAENEDDRCFTSNEIWKRRFANVQKP